MAARTWRGSGGLTGISAELVLLWVILLNGPVASSAVDTTGLTLQVFMMTALCISSTLSRQRRERKKGRYDQVLLTLRTPGNDEIDSWPLAGPPILNLLAEAPAAVLRA